jgi:hypothetical protein
MSVAGTYRIFKDYYAQSERIAFTETAIGCNDTNRKRTRKEKI